MSCGISGRFQPLSPSEGQVAHALLARPPLRYPKASFQISPFDLHVLGMPPAFVLSQDQTLHKIFIPWIACSSFTYLAFFGFLNFSLFVFYHLGCNSFRLFNFQRSSPSSDSFYILSLSLPFVNTLFYLFLKVFLRVIVLGCFFSPLRKSLFILSY